MTRSDSQSLQETTTTTTSTSRQNSLDNVDEEGTEPSPGGSGANANRISSYAPKWFKRAFK